MKNKKRVLSIILAVLLTVGAIIPTTFSASEDKGYIDEDCSVKNTYDEENITYSSEKIEVGEKISYVTVNDVIGAGEYKLSRHGKFEENSGVDGSNAIRFYQVRGSSETDKDVSYIRIFNPGDSNYIWFVPDASSEYTLKISYKTDKNYKFVLRTVGSYGEISYNDKELSVFADEGIDNGWNIASAKFVTSKNTTSVYIAVVTENGKCDSEAEVYIDNVAVMLPGEAPKYVAGKTYSSKFNNVANARADGWKGYFSTDPQAGVPFTEMTESDYTNETYYETWGGAVITRSQKQGKYNTFNNWNNAKVFTNMAALTYTPQKYKYFELTVEYKYAAKDNPWPLVVFNQQNITPEMFYRSDNVTNPTYSEDPIAVSPNYAGSIRIFGKKASGTQTISKNMDADNSPQWHKMKIIVTMGNIYAAIYDKDGNLAIEWNAALDENYKGGYIALMQNGVSHFKNISITELKYTGDYSSKFNNVDAIKADGWKGYFSTDPQAGVAFAEIADSDYDEYYETWGGAVITRSQKPGKFNTFNNWNNEKVFTNMAALTYTAQKYKYFDLTVEYKYAGSGNPWPLVVFNQQNITPEMFYRPDNVTNPTYSEDPIAVSPNYGGSIRVFGKKASGTKTISANMDTDASPQWHKMKISVTPGSVYTAIYDKDGKLAIELTTPLDESYQGGYITLMQNGVSHFKNISISELHFTSKPVGNDGYSSPFNNVANARADGWKGYFSTDPQAGVAFAEIADSDYDEYYETWGGAVITRSQKQGKYNTFNNWNNAKVFTNMAALTYTPQKYKYFELTVEYKYAAKDNPWPLVVFNQQNITPEMFYRSDNVTNPTYSEDPIAVSPNYAGSIRVFGKKASDSKTMSPQMDADSSPQWHKMKISVTPGNIYAAVYDKDGKLALELTTPLDESYQGGYITLMQNGVSHFKNISIKETHFTVVDMKQNEDSEIVVDLDETEASKTILVSTGTKRLYDLKSISAVSENGISYKVSLFTTDTYKIENAHALRLKVVYQKRKLDYDPEYTLKYYFDWEEELEEFTASRTPHPDDTALEAVNTKDRWKISGGILSKPEIDYTGTTKTTAYFADTNILMLKDMKFRNFELTVQYMHGKSGGYSCGVIFGIQDPEVFCNNKDGGIFVTVEADARATLYGKSLRNSDVRIIPGDGVTNLPGYPKWDTTQIHTMKIRVLDGRVELVVDDANADNPVIGIIPKDYYGYIALAVGNNKGWYDNLTIQPLDEWGNKISLAENEKQSAFNPEDIETDTWEDNSEWE